MIFTLLIFTILLNINNAQNNNSLLLSIKPNRYLTELNLIQSQKPSNMVFDIELNQHRKLQENIEWELIQIPLTDNILSKLQGLNYFPMVKHMGYCPITVNINSMRLISWKGFSKRNRWFSFRIPGFNVDFPRINIHLGNLPQFDIGYFEPEIVLEGWIPTNVNLNRIFHSCTQRTMAFSLTAIGFPPNIGAILDLYLTSMMSCMKSQLSSTASNTVDKMINSFGFSINNLNWNKISRLQLCLGE